MKYTIELTEKQRKRFKHMNKALIKMGMGFDILSLLEPVNTTNVEDTDEYQMGYKVGREDGYTCCRNNTELIYELKQAEYNKGLEDAWKLAKKIALNESDGGYRGNTICEIFNAMCYDVLANYTIHEVKEKIEAYEEKKKTDEESIKVGDEVETEGGYKAIVAYISCDGKEADVMFSDGSTGKRKIESLSKTGRNFNNEVEQLFDKLKSKEK